MDTTVSNRPAIPKYSTSRESTYLPKLGVQLKFDLVYVLKVAKTGSVIQVRILGIGEKARHSYKPATYVWSWKL